MGGSSPKVIVISLLLVCILIALTIVVRAWQHASTQKAQLKVTAGDETRRMADEYRRLTEMAVTAQEHTDLRLAELAQQVTELRGQLASVQQILTDVE
jgi:Tfp pilus assembly protein PilO